MNGVHDMGGMDGFGKVVPEPNEPAFHAPWEGRVLAMNRVMQATGEWNIDVGRYWIETLPPHTYLGVSYYEKWMMRLENLCVARGLVTRAEVEAGHAAGPGRPLKKAPISVAAADNLTCRGKYDRPAQAPAQFKIGDRVRMKNIHPKSHTRLPRFARGHTGTIERVHGCHVYPDSYVAEGKEDPQWLYTVVFDNRELWGPDADPSVEVSIEAFEPYLERA
jgi:nitrile hydratase beta subunit